MQGFSTTSECTVLIPLLGLDTLHKCSLLTTTTTVNCISGNQTEWFFKSLLLALQSSLEEEEEGVE